MAMVIRVLLILFTVLLVQNVHSQTNKTNNDFSELFESLTDITPGQGAVTIQQDDQLQSLVLRYIEYRKKDNTIPGYRIRIFSDSGQPARQRAYSERDRFASLYTDIIPYTVYEQPNFKVYVGDFRTRGEAYKVYKQIQKDFPRSFLVFTKINPPKLY
jgi:hypothetical protein